VRLGRAQHALRGRRAGLVVFVAYALAGFLCLGLPLLVEQGPRYVGFGYDPQIFIWSFAWWPHAIAHGQNPFVTHAVWAPDGLNLTWATTVPGLALAFAPLTLAAGPIVSYDTAAILMPVFAAWTAFALCRYLTRAIWPSVVGGFLFGFSSYAIAQGGGGHLHMSSVFLLPLVVLVVLRFLDGRLAARGLALRLGPILALQLLLSTEVAFMLTVWLVVALALAALLVPVRRARIIASLPALAGAYAVGAVLASPFLYYVLAGFHSGGFNAPENFVADLLNFAVPTKDTLIGGGWAAGVSGRFPGNPSEQDAYLGLPALLLVAVFLWRRRGSPSGRFLAACLAFAVVATLGGLLSVDGHRPFELPWKLVQGLPGFDNVLTSRLSVYVALLAAVIVALWTAERRPGPLRWLVPALAVLAIVPDPAAGGFATRYDVPAFFTDAAYRNCVDPGAIVLPLPIRGDEWPLWQAADGFRFALAGGDIAPFIPGSFQAPGAMATVTSGIPVSPDQASSLRTFIAEKRVSTVLLDERQESLWSGALDRIATPVHVGGVVLYQVEGAAPSCAGG
jgi:hypothetical protein